MNTTLRISMTVLLSPIATHVLFSQDAVQVRSAAHEKYAARLWAFSDTAGFYDWSVLRGDFPLDDGPGDIGDVRVFLNSVARRDIQDFGAGSCVVCEHRRDADVLGVTIYVLPLAGDPWYWAHYLPDGTVVKTAMDRNPFAKDGYYARLVDGRLWVFPLVDSALVEYLDAGSYEKHVTMPGSGPGGLTIKGPSREVIQGYLTQRDGFVTEIRDDRLWVFAEGTPEASDLQEGNVSDKHVTRVAAGPLGLTIKSSDLGTINSYLTQKDGFETAMIDSRLWVFREGSDEWNEFRDNGPSDKHVTQVGVGPNGLTVKSTDHQTIRDYVTSAKGFQTFVEDGRLWVFLDRSDALSSFLKSGEPAKCVTRVGDGPLGMTIKSDDATTIEMYLAAVAQE